jgi:hypothetical protein
MKRLAKTVTDSIGGAAETWMKCEKTKENEEEGEKLVII